MEEIIIREDEDESGGAERGNDREIVTHGKGQSRRSLGFHESTAQGDKVKEKVGREAGRTTWINGRMCLKLSLLRLLHRFVVTGLGLSALDYDILKQLGQYVTCV